MASLRSKRNAGRSPRLTEVQKAEIKKAIQELPEKYGVPGKRWRGKNLSLYIRRQYGITLKDRSCQRLIREPGGGCADVPSRCHKAKTVKTPSSD